MDTSVKIPFYLRISVVLIGIVALFFILFIGQGIIVPLIFSFIIAILLNPVVNYLCRKNINRVIAILLSILLAIFVLTGLVYFISSQIVMFSELFPQLVEKFNFLADESIRLAAQTFNVKTEQINGWIAQMKSEALTAGKAFIGPTIISIGGAVAILLLLPVYVFMILFYKQLFLEFINKLFTSEEQPAVAEIITESKLLIQNYLIGLIIETGIVAVLNTVGLLIIGIEYAVLLGVIGALLNIIPYIGGIVAMALTIIVALTTESPIYALWVFIIFGIVQFADNNVIVPKIVASKVKINEFVSILAVIIGGALWGIPGMFLAIPLIAIIKVIFDRIEPLQPLGFLFGDSESGEDKQVLKFPAKKR